MKKLLTILSICICFLGVSQTKMENVNAETFKKLVDEKKSILIDLRTDDELKRKGYIKGAIQIDYFDKTADEKILKLDRTKTYLIYCAGGGRSGECTEFMSKNGFTHVVNLEKGFDDWKKKGFEIELKPGN